MAQLPRQSESAAAFFVPDESGMGGDWRRPGEVFYDPDARRWMEQVNKFVARPAEPPEGGGDDG